MAFNLGELLVHLGVDMAGLEQGFSGAKKSLESFGSDMKKAGTTLTAAVTAPLVGIGAAAAKMAMDAVESENLFETSMGKMADSARQWSDDVSQALGLNAYEIRRNTGMLYTMFQSMQLGQQDAMDMSKGLTQLSYDMASFYNLKPEEAFEKLRAGIVGETEPLKQLGILVDENTIKTFAYTHGIAKQGTELTQQQKVMARYGAIMAQTSKAQGDLARTADSPTNQLRIMGQQIKQAAIEFGMALLPAIQEFLKSVKPLIERLQSGVKWFAQLNDSTKKVVITIALVAAALGPVLLGIGAVAGAISNMIPIVVGLGKALMFLAANPIGLVITAIALLVAGGILLYKNWDTVKRMALNTWGTIKAFVAETIAGIMEKYANFIEFFSKAKAEELRATVSTIRAQAEAERELVESRNMMAEQAELAQERAKEHATEQTKIIEETTTQETKATQTKITALDILEHKIRRLTAGWNEYQAQVGDVSLNAAVLATQMKYLEQKLDLEIQQVILLSAQYEIAKHQSGEFGEETMDLADKLDTARVSVAETEAAIRDISPTIVAAQIRLKDASKAVSEMEDWIDTLSGRLDKAQGELDQTSASIKKLEDSTKTAQSGISDALGVMAGKIKDIKQEIDDTTSALQGMANVRLKGQSQFEQQLFELAMQEAQIRLEINRLRRGTGEAAADEIEQLEKRLKAVGLEREKIELERTLEVEPMRRELQRLTSESKEFTFEQAKAQIESYRQQIDTLSGKHARMVTEYDLLLASVAPLIPTLTDTGLSFDEAKTKITDFKSLIEQNNAKLDGPSGLIALQAKQQHTIDMGTQALNSYKAELEKLMAKEKEATSALDGLRVAANGAANMLRSIPAPPAPSAPSAPISLPPAPPETAPVPGGKPGGGARGGIHYFADGGIVSKPTLGIVGEAGTEVIAPLPRLQELMAAVSAGASAFTARVMSMGGGVGGMTSDGQLAMAMSGGAPSVNVYIGERQLEDIWVEMQTRATRRGRS